MQKKMEIKSILLGVNHLLWFTLRKHMNGKKNLNKKLYSQSEKRKHRNIYIVKTELPAVIEFIFTQEE